jgi:hypothetical protein
MGAGTRIPADIVDSGAPISRADQGRCEVRVPDTVVSSIPDVSAICAAVKRRRRIASQHDAAPGERSNKPRLAQNYNYA